MRERQREVRLYRGQVSSPGRPTVAWRGDRVWTSRDELRIAIVTWIERDYHRRRRQARRGRLTPIEYETIMTTPAHRAA